MNKVMYAVLLTLFYSLSVFSQDNIRVLVIMAHPDEAEEYAGGSIALFSKYGDSIRIASLTNGDVGHWTMTKEALAERRKNEANAAGKILGATYEILNHHDGELEATISLRKEVVRIIREWKPDIVISFLQMFGGGHPDNMVVAKTVQESAGLSMAPLFLPEIPALTRKPVFLVVRDYFSKSFAHQPDIVIPIDKTLDLKLESFSAHASQFFEFAPFQKGILDEVPKDEAGRKPFFEKYWGEFSAINPAMRKWLISWFGESIASSFNYAEEFEFAPYSRRPLSEELLKLFPMLAK